jgi:hypothetical protein
VVILVSDLYKELWGSPEEEIPVVSFSGMALAKYFKMKLDRAIWSGFGMVNLTALAAQFNRWKGKVDSDTIKSCIDLYMDDPELRGKNPGWQDFLYRLEQIHAKLNEVTPQDKWAALEKEWMEKYGSDAP